MVSKIHFSAGVFGAQRMWAPCATPMFAAFISAQRARWSKVIRDAKIKLEQ